MTVSARFLFFIAVLTLVGCTPAEKPAADLGSGQDASQEEGTKKASDSEARTASADEMKLTPAPTLDLKTPALDLKNSAIDLKNPTMDLLPSEFTLPEPFQAEPLSLSEPALAEGNPLSKSENREATSDIQPPMVPSEKILSTGLSSTDLETLPLIPITPAASPPLQSTPEPHANPLRVGEVSDEIRPGMEAFLDPSSGESQGNGLRRESLPEGVASTVPDETASGETASTDVAALPASGKQPENGQTESKKGQADSQNGQTESKKGQADSQKGQADSKKGQPNSKGQFFDPIKENGPIFVDWPKPELALVMTGRQNGYIEPCGCAGMERMKGGLTRRDTLIKDLIQKRKWPVIALDVGNQVKGHKRQTELKFRHTTEALLEMGYSGVGLGIADLQLPAGELAAITSNENSPFVSANIDLFEAGTELIAKCRIVEENGVKIGITAVLGDSFRKQVNNKSIPTTDPVAAIQQVAKSLKECDVRVLLAYANREESIALAKRFPMFNVVVTAAGGSEPPKDSVVIPGTKTYLVEVGEKGEFAIVLGIYRDRDTPVRYQRVTLDSRFATSKKIHHLMSAYQGQLKMLGLEGLNIKPVPCPEAKTKGKYVGSKACETCHEESYDIWRKSKHAKAWKTLVEADPPRNHDPECISCHVVGWDPQRYYPFVGGFVSPEKTPELENVGCESCHGPGGAHVTAESGGNIELQERLQKAMIVTVEESRSNPQKMCYNCHDLDNSPEFDFDKYWSEVQHYETESGEKEEDE